MAAPQLRVCRWRQLDLTKLDNHQIDHLADRIVGAARINGQVAGIAIRAQTTEDRIRKPALFANVLKESRAHRPAQHGVEHVTRIPIVVVLRVAARAHADVTLLEVLVADNHLRHDRWRCIGRPRRARWHRLERRQNQLPYPRMLDVAGGRHDDVAGGIGRLEILSQALLRERLNRLSRPEDRAPQRMPLPEALREHFVDEIVGRILDHLDLFEHDLFFALNVHFLKRRVHDDVRQDVDGKGQMLIEHLDVVTRVLLGRKRVELAANRVDRLCDVFGTARRRALEQHVLDKVRDAALSIGLVARSARQPHTQAHRSHLPHRLGKETKTVVQSLAHNHGVTGLAPRTGSPLANASRCSDVESDQTVEKEGR